jgi:hypothetical protein
VGVAIAITLQHVVVDQLTWKWLGLGLDLIYQGLPTTSSFSLSLWHMNLPLILLLILIQNHFCATHSTTSCTDSKSFLRFEVCDLKPTRHQNHSKLMLIYAFGITHYASGSICA